MRALVFINTLLVQSVLKDEKWRKRMTAADKRGLCPHMDTGRALPGCP